MEAFAESAQKLLSSFESCILRPSLGIFLSATHGAGVLTPGWNLADPVTRPEESRFFVVDVTFASTFASPPVVHLGLTGFDIDQHESARLAVKVGHITEYGFQAVISTWSTTRVYAVEFSWLAIGA